MDAVTWGCAAARDDLVVGVWGCDIGVEGVGCWSWLLADCSESDCIHHLRCEVGWPDDPERCALCNGCI